jgi:hypothetical protein
MKQEKAQRLVALLSALKDTGQQFPEPVKKEINGGWQLLFVVNGQGLSVVCHDFSHDLETAEIIGTAEDWEFADSDACTQVVGYRDNEEVAADIVRVCNGPLRLS